MKAILLIFAIVLVAAGLLLVMHLRLQHKNAGPAIHVQNAFNFTVHVPYEKVFPLFGAHGERAWAGDDWDPQFVYPQPAQDVEGEVFTVTRSHGQSVWVNTAFDPASGHVQYVYVIPAMQAVRIDIHLRHDEPAMTAVKVVYERTALTSRFNDRIREMGQKDSQSGEEWRGAIEKYLTVAK